MDLNLNNFVKGLISRDVKKLYLGFLYTLEDMRDGGIISDDEFNRQRKRVLDHGNKKKKQWLYEFEAVETIRNEDGSQESKTRYFSIAKPNRRAREEGELFYAAETSRFAKAGVLPKAAWNTILSNGGGAISDLDREGYGTLLMRYRDLAFEVQTSLLKDENERTEVESEKLSEAVLELGVIGREVQAFEADQINIFENTAEAKARNRTILWWVMCLAHEKVKTDYKPVIDAKSFEGKLDLYDDLEEDVDGNNFGLVSGASKH